MNQYLLLRDNKQTGPYTAEELAAKGLKAYDLVWLEGKSAAWRYPSEMADLKAFAPVVEEQPYDRFYKKTEEESHPLLEQARQATLKEYRKEPVTAKSQITAEVVMPAQKEAIEETEKIQEETTTYQEPEVPTPINFQPKKIYVTLPASNRNGQKKETNKTAASFSQNIGPIAEDRPVNEVKKKVETPVVSVNQSYSEFDKSPDKELYAQLQESQLSRPQRKRSSRPALIGLIAACFLMFGVIIGLYISNMNQQGKNKELENLVRQIQERENIRNTSAPVTPQQEQPQEMSQSALDSSNSLNTEEKQVEKKIPVSTASKRFTSTPENKQPPTSTVPAGNEDEESLAANTPSQPEAGEKKITYQQAAIESARKNIYQQLLVESSKFKTGVLGGISNLHMTLSNNSRFPLDQVQIEIKYFGPEQKLVKTQTLLFNDLAPGEQKTLEAPRTSRGITIDYAITRINSKVLGLAQQTQF